MLKHDQKDCQSLSLLPASRIDKILPMDCVADNTDKLPFCAKLLALCSGCNRDPRPYPGADTFYKTHPSMSSVGRFRI